MPMIETDPYTEAIDRIDVLEGEISELEEKLECLLTRIEKLEYNPWLKFQREYEQGRKFVANECTEPPFKVTC